MCPICQRDICGAHSVCDPNDQSDYPASWCVDCLAAYRGEIEAEERALDEEYKVRYESLLIRWKEKSLAGAK